jgi:hypothetical protein
MRLTHLSTGRDHAAYIAMPQVNGVPLVLDDVNYAYGYTVIDGH